MGNLITILDFEWIRDISENILPERIDPFITEAQEFDVKPVLGRSLFYAMVSGLEGSPVEEIYTDLFEGKTYTDPSINAEISFAGVRKALIYYAYARLLLNNDMNITSFGNVIKENENYSANADEKRIARGVIAAREAARAYESDYVKYLNDMGNLYPLWLKKNQFSTATKGGITISRVTKRRNRVWCGTCNMNSNYCNCNRT